ncbi:MAG: hypothetical protein LBJ01_06390 [Tannerella sp.]|nr:hypothetical protein [Tannerella sp.]
MQKERPPALPDAAMPNRAPKSTALDRLVDRKTGEAPPPPPSAAGENNREKKDKLFDAEDVIRCWEAYAEALEKEVPLQSTMLFCKPVLLEDGYFEVAVHNSMQEEELIGHSPQLLKMMRDRLGNDNIRMRVRIAESTEKKRAFTSIEKYELLQQINPLLSRLKDEFDLSLE